jgi:hypothetical protein
MNYLKINGKGRRRYPTEKISHQTGRNLEAKRQMWWYGYMEGRLKASPWFTENQSYRPLRPLLHAPFAGKMDAEAEPWRDSR